MEVANLPGKDLGQEGAMLVALQQIMADLKLRDAAQTAELAELKKAVASGCNKLRRINNDFLLLI